MERRIEVVWLTNENLHNAPLWVYESLIIPIGESIRINALCVLSLTLFFSVQDHLETFLCPYQGKTNMSWTVYRVDTTGYLLMPTTELSERTSATLVGCCQLYLPWGMYSSTSTECSTSRLHAAVTVIRTNT